MLVIALLLSVSLSLLTDECSMSGLGCSHSCDSTSGTCVCRPGYELSEDGTSCVGECVCVCVGGQVCMCLCVGVSRC